MGDQFALTPIAGRQHERAVLWGQLEAALGGRLRVALLAGEPGIGKTRLLDDLADRAGAAGMLVLRGGASDAAGMPPYLPLLEAIGQYVRSASDELLRTHAGALAPVLATIIPEIALRLGTLPASYPLPAEQARLRLFEAVGALLATLASAAGLAVVLDDLHWADQATLDLLGYIARRQPAARLLIVGAYREGEITEPAAFGRTIADLTRLHALATVAVGRLDAPDLDTLLSAYLGGPAEPDVGARLLAHSEGNPFFAEELLRSWMEAGALARAGASWRLDQSLAGPLPGSIVLAVRQRVARLTPACADLLRTAALIGRGFAPELLAEVAGQDIEHVEDLLVTATQAQLIRAAGAGLLSFSHDKIRECLYDEVPPQRRRRLHGLIGQALVARPEPAGAPQLAALAFHFTRSGDHEAGIAYSRRAAEQALRAHAPDSAIAHLRTALALLGANDNRRGELLLALGEAASAADQGPAAIEALAEARAWFVQRGDRPGAGRAAYRQGQAYWRIEALGQALAAFEAALVLLEGQPSPELVLTLIDLASLQAMSLHQHEPGMAYSQRALALAHSLEDDRLIASASRAAGNIDVRNGNLAAGITLLEQALALADQADDPVEAAECCAQLSHACYWAGETARAFALAERQLAYAHRTHDAYQLRHMYSLLARGASLQGRWEDAERWIAAAQREVEQLASPEPRAFLQMTRGDLAYERGDYPAALAHYAVAIEAFRVLGPGALVWYLGQYGLAQLAANAYDTARRIAGELAALVEPLPALAMSSAGPLATLALIALDLGDQEQIAALTPRLRPFQGQFHDYLIDRVLGQLLTAQRDWVAAEGLLESAAASARRNSLAPELARTLEAQAALALARGHGSAARSLLADARAVYESLAHPRAMLLRAQPAGQGSRARGPARAYPAGLSPREVEVLRLVVAGSSNREIAAALTLSEKTVANHLASIFAKIGADNRAAAAAFAVRHQLA